MILLLINYSEIKNELRCKFIICISSDSPAKGCAYHWDSSILTSKRASDITNKYSYLLSTNI